MSDLYDEIRSALKSSDDLLDQAMEVINEKNTLIAILDRNCMVLMEIAQAAHETLTEYNKIIKAHHKAILQGEITQENIEEYKKNIQNALKNHNELTNLQNLYNRIANEVPDKDGPWGMNVNAKVG